MGETEAMCEWEGSRVKDHSEKIVEEAQRKEGQAQSLLSQDEC